MAPSSGEDPIGGLRLNFDRSLATLIQHAQEVLASQDRLRELLHATGRVMGELDADLDSVLTHVVEAACELLDADYGALGVLGSDRRHLEHFVHVGIDAETVASIGHLPEGGGLLGLLIDE